METVKQKRKTNNSRMKNTTRIIRLLRKEVGKTTAVVYSRDPFVVLIATVLSQRTRDINTERTTKQLFSKYKTAKQIANAPVKSIEKLIYGSGFYKVKARRIKQLAKIILNKYKGKVPKDMSELIKLPGVGHKTAACVLVYGFNKPELPIDVHVAKMSKRLGWTKEKDPYKIRLDLMKKLPKRYWLEINELMVKYGQRICLTRNPRCRICSLKKLCNYYRPN